MADASDLLTLEEAYLAINDPRSAEDVKAGGEGGHDADVARWVTGVSRRVDDLCGPVVSRTVSETHHGGVTVVELDSWPVDAITTVTEYVGTDPTILTEETNLTHPDDAYRRVDVGKLVTLRRRNSGADGRFPVGVDNIEVDLSAGRYADTASVDAKFKTAVAAIIRRLWQREQGAWHAGAGVDPFDQAEAGRVGFFRAVDPMVAEFLEYELKPDGVS